MSDSYFKKAAVLKAGDRDVAIVRASSPQPRSQSVERSVSASVEKKLEDDKIARIKDVQAVSARVEAAKELVNELHASNQASVRDLDRKIVELTESLNAVRLEADQTKTERLKQKLDSFIGAYNDNETAHSNMFHELQEMLKAVELRLSKVEELL